MMCHEHACISEGMHMMSQLVEVTAVKNDHEEDT